MSIVQLHAHLQVASVDVTPFVSAFTIRRQRDSVVVPASFGNLRQVEKAGAMREWLDITFHSELTASSFWARLFTAMDTPSAELSFEGQLDEGPVTTDNPAFTGRFVVLSLDTGGRVGEVREQTQTYPITAAGVTVSPAYNYLTADDAYLVAPS
jgi:hypothetical protein